jgi:hypothetical protein
LEHNNPVGHAAHREVPSDPNHPGFVPGFGYGYMTPDGFHPVAGGPPPTTADPNPDQPYDPGHISTPTWVTVTSITLGLIGAVLTAGAGAELEGGAAVEEAIVDGEGLVEDVGDFDSLGAWEDDGGALGPEEVEGEIPDVPEPPGSGNNALDQLESIEKAQQRVRDGSDGGRRIIDSIEKSRQRLENKLRGPYDPSDWE